MVFWCGKMSPGSLSAPLGSRGVGRTTVSLTHAITTTYIITMNLLSSTMKKKLLSRLWLKWVFQTPQFLNKQTKTHTPFKCLERELQHFPPKQGGIWKGKKDQQETGYHSTRNVKSKCTCKGNNIQAPWPFPEACRPFICLKTQLQKFSPKQEGGIWKVKEDQHMIRCRSVKSKYLPQICGMYSVFFKRIMTSQGSVKKTSSIWKTAHIFREIQSLDTNKSKDRWSAKWLCI